MSSLGDIVEGFLTGRPKGAAGPGLGELIRLIELESGSGRKAAARVGVAESTWRGWRHGRQPKAAGVERIERTGREIRAKRITNEDIKIHTSEAKSRRNQARSRTIGPNQLRLSPDTAAQVRSAYVNGGPDLAAVALLRNINEPWYRNWLTPDNLRSFVDQDGYYDYAGDDYGVTILTIG